MADTQIAAQLYTLRDFLKTPEDIARTLPRVAQIGYRAVQLSALGPIDTRELKGLCDAAGLTVCATHVGYDRLRDELDAVVDEHRGLDLRQRRAIRAAVAAAFGGVARAAARARVSAARRRTHGVCLARPGRPDPQPPA